LSLRENRIEQAKERILELLTQVKVAYDREIRYRLEKYAIPHDITKAALIQLERKKRIKRTHLRGRPRIGHSPNLFYKLPKSRYEDLQPIMQEKIRLSSFITGVASEVGYHGERVWWRAFKRNNWGVEPAEEDKPFKVRSFRNKTASVNNDIDFIAWKDGIIYGIDVKNSLTYPDDLYWKFLVAVELDTIPMIIARWLNPIQIKLINDLGGVWIIFREAIYPSTYQPMVLKAREKLGYPITVFDEIEDSYFKRKVESVHEKVKKDIKRRKRLLRQFLEVKRDDNRIRKGLGDKRG